MTDNKIDIINGTVVGKHLGTPMQDAQAAKAEDNQAYFTERNQVRYTPNCESVLENQPEENGGTGGVQPDFSQNDTDAADYVKNRTHYEAEEVVNEPLNITWDGNTEGLTNYQEMFYKVSDSVILNNEDIKLIKYKHSQMEEESSLADEFDYPNTLITEDVAFFGVTMFVKKDNAEITVGEATVTIPEKGIYFMKDIVEYAYSTEPVEHTKTVIHKLDKKYLPDDIGNVQPDLSQNDPTADDYVKNRTHYEDVTVFDKITPIIATSVSGGYYSMTKAFCSQSDVVFPEGKCIKITFGDVTLKITTLPTYSNRQYTETIVLSNGVSIKVSLSKYASGSTKTDTKQYYYNVAPVIDSALDPYIGQTFTVELVSEKIITLDEKYIPDTIQRVGGDVIIHSSTADSTKKFKLTVDDSGTISATEVT